MTIWNGGISRIPTKPEQGLHVYRYIITGWCNNGKSMRSALRNCASRFEHVQCFYDQVVKPSHQPEQTARAVRDQGKMTENGPYSLKSQDGKSDAYYHVITIFTDKWLETALEALQRPVEAFLAWEQAADDGIERQPAEAAFEMLVLGVLLREHGAEALQMPSVPAWALAKLVEAQDRMPLPAVEKPAKAVRGLVHGLLQNGQESEGQMPDTAPFGEPASELVRRLVIWLNAHGFSAQADRMAQWQKYLAELNPQAAEAYLARCLLLAEAFSEESQAALGDFTRGVEEYTTCVRANWFNRFRYDTQLITRTQTEYHLGMLGTEILTRAYRSRFLAAKRKIVIVPDCLCRLSPRVVSAETAACQAKLTSLGLKCQNCTPGCRVRQLTAIGEKRGFEVYILPDDLRGIGLGACSKLDNTGVVGVSCVLTNWDAGWLVNSAGVPCQGVLLDYAGCKSHWSETGRSTDVNFDKVLEMVGL